MTATIHTYQPFGGSYRQTWLGVFLSHPLLLWFCFFSIKTYVISQWIGTLYCDSLCVWSFGPPNIFRFGCQFTMMDFGLAVDARRWQSGGWKARGAADWEQSSRATLWGACNRPVVQVEGVGGNPLYFPPGSWMAVAWNRHVCTFHPCFLIWIWVVWHDVMIFIVWSLGRYGL